MIKSITISQSFLRQRTGCFTVSSVIVSFSLKTQLLEFGLEKNDLLLLILNTMQTNYAF